MEFNFDTTEDLIRSYEMGFEGSICDPEDTKNLLADLRTPLFGATAYELYGAGEGKLSLPFLSLVKFDKGFGPSEKQTTGDCVSHAFRNAIDVTRAVEIDVKGDREEFGFSVSIVVEAHVTRRNRLNLIETNFGGNPTQEYQLPDNL